MSAIFIEALNVEEVIAHLLVTEGFTTVEEVAFVPLDEIASIEGFDEDVASELRNRAREWLETQENKFAVEAAELGMTADLLEFEGLTEHKELLIALGRGGVKTLDDLADLATDEFMDIVPHEQSGMREHEVEALIMRAREHWYEGDATAVINAQ